MAVRTSASHTKSIVCAESSTAGGFGVGGFDAAGVAGDGPSWGFRPARPDKNRSTTSAARFDTFAATPVVAIPRDPRYRSTAAETIRRSTGPSVAFPSVAV